MDGVGVTAGSVIPSSASLVGSTVAVLLPGRSTERTEVLRLLAMMSRAAKIPTISTKINKIKVLGRIMNPQKRR